MKVLFVNACVRREDSRTYQLCKDYLSKLPADSEIVEVNLDKEGIKPLDAQNLKERWAFSGKEF